MRSSLQEMRVHLGKCPTGREIDLLCGHCEFRTTSWSAICAHLNRSGMQKEAACRTEYRMSAPSLPLFSAPLTFLTPTTLRDISTTGRRYQGQQGLSPEQLTSFRGEAARLRLDYRLTHCSPSPARVSSRAKRSHALRSTLLQWRTRVDVSRPPGEVDVVGQDVAAGSELLPPVILARRDLTPRTALGMSPLRVWAPCVRVTSSQLLWRVGATSAHQVEQSPRKKGELGRLQRDRPRPGHLRTRGLWKLFWDSADSNVGDSPEESFPSAASSRC